MNTIDLKKANKSLEGATSLRTIAWAREHFGDDLVMTSSLAGDSAVLLDLTTRMIPGIRVIVIDTGYLPDETRQHSLTLISRFKLNLHIFSSPISPERMEKEHGNLWENDPPRYLEMRKLEPMRRALKELRARAVLSGVRKDQTPLRSALSKIDQGNDGICRIHPILDWKDEDIELHKQVYNLPRHPLEETHGSIGDTHSTVPGRGREGRKNLGEHTECGLHRRPQNPLT